LIEPADLTLTTIAIAQSKFFHSGSVPSPSARILALSHCILRRGGYSRWDKRVVAIEIDRVPGVLIQIGRGSAPREETDQDFDLAQLMKAGDWSW
jgi:hypothetical protein